MERRVRAVNKISGVVSAISVGRQFKTAPATVSLFAQVRSLTPAQRLAVHGQLQLSARAVQSHRDGNSLRFVGVALEVQDKLKFALLAPQSAAHLADAD